MPTTTRTRKAAAAPTPEPKAPAAGAKPAQTEVKGSGWLADQVNAACGTSFDAYNIRILLRKLTKDGVIERGEGRYAFTGPKDPTVLAVIKAVKSGAADKAKQERLDELKAKRTAKAEAAAPPAAKATRTRRTPKAAPAEESDDDLDIDEI